MAETAPHRTWTRGAYLAYERDAEAKHVLWDGELFAMAGATREHNLLVAALLLELGAQLRGQPCRPYASDQRIAVPGGDRYVYSDASVTCPPVLTDPDDEQTIQNPRVIAEVLSDSTEAFDRGDKWLGYQRIESLSDYLLVSQKTRRIEHYTRQPGGTWLLRTHAAGDVVSVASLGLTLAVDALYEGVFAPERR